MIFGTNSNYMLKYQKAKAKLVEYDISQKDYPKFPLNSNELSYPVIYILSRYAESIIENDETGKAEFAPYMVKASQYFDASVGANDRTALIKSVSERRNYFEPGTDEYYNRKANTSSANTIGNDTGRTSRGIECYPAGTIELGERC